MTRETDTQAETENREKKTKPARTGPKSESPLAMMLLALLEEHPMHAYGMHKLMLDRGQEHLVNIERRNSIQQVLSRLNRDGHVETVEGDTGRRIVYRISDSGRSLLFEWLRTEIGRPGREYPRFTAAVSLLGLLTPSEVAKLLTARRAKLEEEARRLDLELEQGDFLPAVLTLEVDLRLATTRAEVDWLDRVIADVESNRLTWDREELLTFSTAGHHDEAP